MKTVVVTGSTSGIGLGIARAFAREKYNVVINGFSDHGIGLATEIQNEFGVSCFYSEANLKTKEGVKSLIDFAYSKLGDIGVLINNAGLQHVASLEDFPDEKWDEIIAVNMSSVFHAIKHVMPKMKSRKWGRIINIASVHGLVASEYKAAYVTAKHGVIGLTKVVALEGASFGITCNSICPGYVKTPLVEGQIKDQAKTHGISEEDVVKKVMLAKHAIKDFVSIESIAKICLMLASEDAALMTGSALTIDGGWTAS